MMNAEHRTPSTEHRPDRGPWMQTYTGVAWYWLDPRAADVRIEDIAHHLARKCRFNGATRGHASVAQHSVLVSLHVPEAYALDALLHDAGEAYLPDVCRALKPQVPRLGELEDAAMAAVCERFGVKWPFAEDVRRVIKKADLGCCATEARDQMGPKPMSWNLNAAPWPSPLRAWEFAEAKAAFLERFVRLYLGKGQ